MNEIKFLVMDVDGTLTDGKIYMSDNGELFKAFDVKDGCGIKDVLPTVGIIPVIITARTSKMLENRSKELEITYLFQGTRNKTEKLIDILKEYNEKNGTNYTLGNCAYVGDDILDIPCMSKIKENGGLAACPNNAVKEVLDISDFISSKNGGEGAVREFIDYLVGKIKEFVS